MRNAAAKLGSSVAGAQRYVQPKRGPIKLLKAGRHNFAPEPFEGELLYEAWRATFGPNTVRATGSEESNFEQCKRFIDADNDKLARKDAKECRLFGETVEYIDIVTHQLRRVNAPRPWNARREPGNQCNSNKKRDKARRCTNMVCTVQRNLREEQVGTLM